MVDSLFLLHMRPTICDEHLHLIDQAIHPGLIIGTVASHPRLQPVSDFEGLERSRNQPAPETILPHSFYASSE